MNLASQYNKTRGKTQLAMSEGEMNTEDSDMNAKQDDDLTTTLQPGLYVVATPIGNLQDISLRALNVLRQVDLIAAEDTRHSQKLLRAYQINTPCCALHEHNENARIDALLARLTQQQKIALISDAGTPLISDPGYRLVVAARNAHFAVIPVPGCCAAIAALSVAGMPSDRFCFEGFLPVKEKARTTQLMQLSDETRTLIFYEAPHRVLDTLNSMITVFGATREMTLARELTKQFETILSGTLAEILKQVTENPMQQKGEFVLIVQGSTNVASNIAEDKTIQIWLKALLQELPLSQAVKIVAHVTGERRQAIYQLALKVTGKV